jgi:DNA-binding NarL/FixJ family response regulator
VKQNGIRLSGTEQAVARLAARGRTNQEIADTLDLSPKTVEWNLTKIYRGLGVRSRTELAILWPHMAVSASDERDA